jgi:hypothetical protein
LKEELQLRKLFIGALVGVMTLAVAAVALADSATVGTTTQNFTMNFAKPDSNGDPVEVQKPKTSVGIFADLSSSNPSNPKNGQTDALRELDLDLPTRTKVDPSAAAVCRASDTELEQEGPEACPDKSRIGTGFATAKFPTATAPNGSPLPDPQIDVVAFNARGGLLLHLQPTIGGVPSNPIILRPDWEGRLNNGPVLHTEIEPNCLPPAQNVNGTCRDPSTGAEGDEVILNSFQLVTEPKTKTVKKKVKGKKKKKTIRKKLITTPRTCPSGGWEFVGDFLFASGGQVEIPYKDNCTR